MTLLFSFIWGLINVVVLFLSIRFYMPKLLLKYAEQYKESGTDINSESILLTTKKQKTCFIYVSFIIMAIILSAICGYTSLVRQDILINMFKMILSLCISSIISLTDLILYTIPNKCVLILFIGRIICLIPEIFLFKDTWLLGLVNCFIASLASVLFLLLTSKITHGGIGFGDIKLFGALGFLCGVRAIAYTLIFSFFLCSAVSVVLLIAKKKKLKDGLPLGPFVWLGFALSIIFGLC